MPEPAMTMTAQQVAEYLGVSESAFHANRRAWVACGFPAPDAILRRYIKADIDAWLKSRRQIRESDTMVIPTMGVNYDSL